MTAPQRRDRMEIAEDRYGRGSILLTSQLPVEVWPDVIGEPTLTDAILDRFVIVREPMAHNGSLHNAHRLPLDGPSMRKASAHDDHPAHRHARHRASAVGALDRATVRRHHQTTPDGVISGVTGCIGVRSHPLRADEGAGWRDPV